MRVKLAALPAILAVFVSAPAAQAQDINVNGSLGNLYQNLYLSTHMFGGGGRRTHRVVRPAHASPVWNAAPARSATLKRLIAALPAENRASGRAALTQALGTYPAIVRYAAKTEGIPLSPSDPRDAATLAGVLSYQCLVGHDITASQFRAEHAATRRTFASHETTAAEMQSTGEVYSAAICLMVMLKAYAGNPQNKDPDLTRRQLQQLALKTFQVGYKSADYAQFAATDHGIVKTQ